MEITDKKLKRTRKIIYFLISFVLAIFLILLSNTIIDDLDRTVKYPDIEECSDQAKITELRNQISTKDDYQNQLYAAKSEITKTIKTLNDNKDAEQESFDNWIKTRGALQSSAQNPEVLKRINKIDEYKNVIQEWTVKSDSLSTEIDKVSSQNSSIQQEIYTLQEAGEKVFQKEYRSYSLKVFLIRLLFVGPILALGIFFFIRKRNSKLSPLYMGFTLFSIYAFFIGLVPYLPSYGGYVRYIVGILLTIGLGYYGIKKIREYSDRKRRELKTSSEERSKRVDTDVAEKALQNHVCPSCGKDFLIKGWNTPDKKNFNASNIIKVSNFCRFCGLELMKNCPNCNELNYAHLPFCSNCGAAMKKTSATNE